MNYDFASLRTGTLDAKLRFISDLACAMRADPAFWGSLMADRTIEHAFDFAADEFGYSGAVYRFMLDKKLNEGRVFMIVDCDE